MKTLHQYCLLASARLEHTVLFSSMNRQKNAQRGLKRRMLQDKGKEAFLLNLKQDYISQNKFLQERKNILADIFLVFSKHARQHSHHEKGSKGPSGENRFGLRKICKD